MEHLFCIQFQHHCFSSWNVYYPMSILSKLDFYELELGNPSMEQRTLQNVNHCLNTNIYSYLETSCGQSSNLYLNVIHFFNTSVN
jgi:hypothetical protein